MERMNEPLWPSLYDLALQTERLTIRFPKPEEEEAVIDLTFDAAHTVDAEGRGFTEGMTWNPPAEKNETREFMQKNKVAWNEGSLSMVIFIENNKPIGRCLLGLKEGQNDVWEIGYWMHPDFQGKGYMTEAASELVRYAIEELLAQKVVASAARWNTSSQKVLLKSGMERLPPTDEDGVMKNGEFVPQFKYQITREQYGNLNR